MTERLLADRWMAAAVFAVALTVYLGSGDVQPGRDPSANVALPANVLLHGRLSFAPEHWPELFIWQQQADGSLSLQRPGYYLTASLRDDARGAPRYVNSFGIGAGLTALPVYAVASLAADLREPATRWRLGKLSAALCAAGVVALGFLIARTQLGTGAALWVAAALGLGTGVWSTASQTLWQHAPNELFLLLGFWCLLRPPAAWPRAAAGAALAWAVLCRPTSALVLLLAAVHVLVTERRLLLAFCAGAAPVLLALAAHNAYYLGSPLSFGQIATSGALAANASGDAGLWTTPFLEGAAGQLFSPARGLLVYSPFLAAALLGAWQSWRPGGDVRFRSLSVIALALLAADMKWWAWWGGWSYGYRLKLDAAVLLALLLVPAMPVILRHEWARFTFLAALVWSIGVHALGALAYDFDGWNNRLLYQAAVEGRDGSVILTPEQARYAQQMPGVTIVGPLRADVDDPAFRYRLWSVSDSPILYYATNFTAARANRREQLDALFAERGPRIVVEGRAP